MYCVFTKSFLRFFFHNSKVVHMRYGKKELYCGKIVLAESVCLVDVHHVDVMKFRELIYYILDITCLCFTVSQLKLFVREVSIGNDFSFRFSNKAKIRYLRAQIPLLCYVLCLC